MTTHCRKYHSLIHKGVVKIIINKQKEKKKFSEKLPLGTYAYFTGSKKNGGENIIEYFFL